MLAEQLADRWRARRTSTRIEDILVFNVEGLVLGVRRFIGRRRATYNYASPVADQMINALSGATDEPARIGELYRFTAAPAPVGEDRRGVAVLTPNGRLIVLALLRPLCTKHPPTRDCYRHAALTIFARSSGAPRPVVENLRAWAKAELTEVGEPEGLRKVEVVVTAQSGGHGRRAGAAGRR